MAEERVIRPTDRLGEEELQEVLAVGVVGDPAVTEHLHLA
jgi:hypothetical protein